MNKQQSETGIKSMNKQQWKAEYSALRALFTAAVRMDNCKETPQRNAAFKIIWGSAECKGNGLYYALINSKPYLHYPISKYKWAVKNNARGY